MTRFVVDTNIYSDAAANDVRVVEQFRLADKLFIPAVVLGELRAGFKGGKREVDNESRLRRFLASARVEILAVDEGTSLAYADLTIWLKKNGTPIPINDIWIGALSVQHRLALYTRDAHFDKLPQVARV